MKNKKLITLLAAAATAVAVPSIAAADRAPRGGWSSGWTSLGVVDTHKDDVEDFVPVSPARHFDSLVVQSNGGVIPLDGIKIQYTDGRLYQPYARGVLRPGQRMTIDIPEGEPPIKMIVLDYGHRGARDVRARATARLEVLAYDDGRNDRFDRRYDRRDERYDRREDRRDRRQDRRAIEQSYEQSYVEGAYYDQQGRRVYTQYPQRDTQPRFVWRGGVFIRIN